MGDVEYVFSTVQGNNDELLPGVMRLYVPEGSRIADVTYGRGNFWNKMDMSKYEFLPSDIAPKDDTVLQADFRFLPYPDEYLDALVLDPPYLYTGGWKTLRGYFHDGGAYGNKKRSSEGISGVKAVDQLYYNGIAEAARVLRHKGKLLLKCMDQVQSGKQEWAHVVYMEYAEELGFRNEDLFVLMRNGKPLMRHKPEQQKHARKNHSYLLVQKRWRK